MLIDLLRADGSIVVNKRLAHAIGIDAAILFSELISKEKYFKDRSQLTDDGFFFNTVENIQADTTLSKDKQLKALKVLVENGLIKQENRGLPRKRYFKVIKNEENIKRILLSQQLAVFTTTSKKKIRQQEDVKVDNNNTKSNNLNINNSKKTIYIISENDEFLFRYYDKRYLEHFGKRHPTMNEEKMKQLERYFTIFQMSLESLLSFEVDDDVWRDLVDYHFDNLPESNNGNILAFLSTNGGNGPIHRYVEEIYETAW